MQAQEISLRKKIKTMLILFIVLLILSGITAFPLETELYYLHTILGNSTNPLALFINEVYFAIKDTNQKYPYMSYGTDWLTFAHIVIAVAFYGPLKDPVRNKWILQFGMIACVMVFPLAGICGIIRDIPWYWICIDCSFGVFGFMPLYYCYNKINQLELLEKSKLYRNDICNRPISLV
jgi:lysylphosphatidylglycerol synthetase-like protein (DUF2156 family)